MSDTQRGRVSRITNASLVLAFITSLAFVIGNTVTQTTSWQLVAIIGLTGSILTMIVILASTLLQFFPDFPALITIPNPFYALEPIVTESFEGAGERPFQFTLFSLCVTELFIFVAGFIARRLFNFPQIDIIAMGLIGHSLIGFTCLISLWFYVARGNSLMGYLRVAALTILYAVPVFIAIVMYRLGFSGLRGFAVAATVTLFCLILAFMKRQYARYRQANPWGRSDNLFVASVILGVAASVVSYYGQFQIPAVVWVVLAFVPISSWAHRHFGYPTIQDHRPSLYNTRADLV